LNLLDGVKINVNVDIEKVNVFTGEKRMEHYHNLTVDAGLNLLRDFIFGDAVTGLSHFAIGTGTTAEAAGDIALGVEVFRDVFTQKTKLAKGVQFQYFLNSTSANGSVISEGGLFGNGATGVADSGTMYARVTMPADTKTNAEAWTFTWTVTWEVV
jgi:hypothetical protein